MKVDRKTSGICKFRHRVSGFCLTEAIGKRLVSEMKVHPIVFWIFNCSVVLFVPLSKASTIRHDLDAQLYRDEAALYPMVGSVNGSGFNGSGVLISDRWVLTAGHVADFKAGGSFRVGGVDYIIQSVFSHPNHPTFTTTFDMGLLYLSSQVVGIEAATMLRLPTSSSLLGKEATWVGNGLTGTGVDDNRGSNEMRAFTNVVDGFTPNFGLPMPSFYADFDNPGGTSNSLAFQSSDANPTRLEGNVTPGDSGGGVFINEDGRNYLIGINSYTSGFAPGLNSKYGSLSGAADLDLFHDWIFTTSGISAVPEPGVLGLVCFGSICGLRRRR